MNVEEFYNKSEYSKIDFGSNPKLFTKKELLDFANEYLETITVILCCKSDSEHLKTFNIHQCINEIVIEANKCDNLFSDASKDNSFRYGVKKAIDKMLYSK